MVVAESLAVFALAKTTINALKGAVDTAQDINSLYTGLDKLFHVKKQCELEVAKKKPKKPKSKLHVLFTKTTKENSEDSLSVGAVAAMVLEQKKLDRQIKNLGIRIDNKFGYGTWDEILNTREKLLEERKVKKLEAKKPARKIKEKQNKTIDKIFNVIIDIFKIIFVILFTYGFGYIIWINRCVEGNC